MTLSRDALVVARRRFELFLPILSLARLAVGPSTNAGRVVGLCVLGTVFYLLAPRVYPDTLGTRQDDGLRTSFAVVSVGFVLAFTWVRTSLWGVVAAFAVLLVTIAGFDAYLAYRKNWALFDSEGKAAEVGNEITPHDLHAELAEDFDRTGWQGVTARGAWLGALGVFFAIPAFLAGLLGSVLGLAFPVPDLLLLGAVAFDAVTRTAYQTDQADLPDRLYSVVESATSSLKGAVLVLLVAIGVFLSAQVLATALRVAGQFVRGQPASPATTSSLWSVFGILAGLVAVSAFDFLFWVRVTDRIPTFLAVRDEDADASSRDVPSYPFGLTLPPTLALTALALFTFHSASGPTWGFAFTLGWPLLIVGLVVSATGALSRGRVSKAEDWAIAVALLVQIVGRTVVAHSDRLSAIATDPRLLVSFVVVPLVVLLPDVIRFAQQYDDARRYATGGYLLYFGGLLAIVSLTNSEQTAFLLRVFAAVTSGGGLLLLVAEYVFE